jgi:hypothetical protein
VRCTALPRKRWKKKSNENAVTRKAVGGFAESDGNLYLANRQPTTESRFDSRSGREGIQRGDRVGVGFRRDSIVCRENLNAVILEIFYA